jgi:hypothetical protein
MKLKLWFISTALILVSATAYAGPIEVTLEAASSNPTTPRMGDRLAFHSVIRNTGAQSVNGLIAWISLLRIDPGNEQPVDLEDWSAQKALTVDELAPGVTLTANWPMRLINAGTYRVVVSTVTRDAQGIITSPALDFSVAPKPVVESRRVLPVALGIPFLLGLAAFLRRWQGRKPAGHPHLNSGAPAQRHENPAH